ncbi:MAG TPA: VOC family protein [Alphaproteobacteria bacterium]|nr:VOC family protein [Alphaproteobacteria bacterium]
MANGVPRLDHVVVDVRGRMEEALAAYRSLGFHLTERSRHSLGSFNHLAVFATDYLELLGLDEKAAAARPEIASYPVGLNGLVFWAEDPDRLSAELKAAGLAAMEPVSFSRPVRLAQGTLDAKFRVVRLKPGSVSLGRVYFCHHFTPELVWRPEWRRHPNRATHIARIAIAVRDPAASQQLFAAMFGGEVVRAGAGGSCSFSAGAAEVELVAEAALGHRLGAAMPDAAGRADYMALLGFRTTSLAQAAAALRRGGVKSARIEPQHILVPANAAMNVALEFVE